MCGAASVPGIYPLLDDSIKDLNHAIKRVNYTSIRYADKENDCQSVYLCPEPFAAKAGFASNVKFFQLRTTETCSSHPGTLISTSFSHLRQPGHVNACEKIFMRVSQGG